MKNSIHIFRYDNMWIAKGTHSNKKIKDSSHKRKKDAIAFVNDYMKKNAIIMSIYIHAQDSYIVENKYENKENS